MDQVNIESNLLTKKEQYILLKAGFHTSSSNIAEKMGNLSKIQISPLLRF